MSDSYLKIAEETIRRAGKPLRPKEMLKIAKELNLIPEHLFGKTQFKTLAARLSTDIRSRTEKSKFFRVAANQFFLRDLKSKSQLEYAAPKRQKTLHNEYVLTVTDKFLKEIDFVGLFPNVQTLLASIYKTDHLEFVVRKNAEKRYDIKQFISYAIILKDNRILTYRRGVFNNAADELQGKRSIGFGGHVTQQDHNLFDVNGIGIVENARRELTEELQFNQKELENLDRASSFKFLCGINTYETNEAKKHIAVAVIYNCTNTYQPVKNEMSIKDLRWLNLEEVENNLDDFEPWSKTILSAVYDGRLKIE